MRVIYLHQYFNTPAMSGGTRSYEMARRLVADGHTVHMVTSWRDGTERQRRFVEIIDGIHVHWIPVPYSNKMGFASRLWAFLNFAVDSTLVSCRMQCDVVFATSTPLTICIPGIITSLIKRVPLVFEIRDLWPLVPIEMGILKNRLLQEVAKWLERYAYRKSRRIIALAPGMKESVVANGVPGDVVSVIPNGSDIPLFTASDGKPSLLLSEYPWIRDKKVIVYAGTIGLANGVAYIPRLAHRMIAAGPGNTCCFVVIGDGKYRGEAEDVSRQLRVLDSCVHFLGARPKIQVAEWMKVASATIMTYDGPEAVFRDSVSNKFFDSLAAGKPILSNFRGFSTLVAERMGAGRILHKTNLDLAATACLEFMQNGEALRLAGLRASELARDVFSRDALYRDFESVLRDACQPAHVPVRRTYGGRFMEIWAQQKHDSRK